MAPGMSERWLFRGEEMPVPATESRSMALGGRNHKGDGLDVGARDTPKKMLLVNGCSAGDVLMLTAAIRDLHHACPGQYLTGVETCFPDIWRNNPYIAALSPDDAEVTRVECHHPPLLDHCSDRPGHYVESVHDLLRGRLGHEIPLTRVAPDLHLSDEEKALVPHGLNAPY